MASHEDHQRFADKTGEIPGTPECLEKLPKAECFFRLDDAKTLGTDTLWFTFRSVVDKILTMPQTPSPTRADMCRDVLGLIHRQPRRNSELYLVALHVPSQVLQKNGHFRPTFVEANDHLRFSAKARDAAVTVIGTEGRRSS